VRFLLRVWRIRVGPNTFPMPVLPGRTRVEVTGLSDGPTWRAFTWADAWRIAKAEAGA
jgi:hypothetical protein